MPPVGLFYNFQYSEEELEIMRINRQRNKKKAHTAATE
jgi:hypothetical protein